MDETPMPQRTFKILRHMPSVFVEMAVVMGGIYWVVERREKLARERAEQAGAEAEEAEGTPDGDGSGSDDGPNDSEQAKQS